MKINAPKILSAIVISACCVTAQAKGSNNGNGSTPNGQPFQYLQAQIEQINADIDALAANMDAAIASIEADLVVVKDSISDLQAQISANDAQIAALQTDTQNNAQAIADLEATNTLLADQLADLEAELATKQDALAGECAEGSSLRVINPDGTYLCEFDDTDTLQVRLTAVGPWVSTSSDYRILRTAVSPSCPAGTFVASGNARMQSVQSRRAVNISESASIANRWRVRFTRTYANGFNRVRAEALCLRGLN